MKKLFLATGGILLVMLLAWWAKNTNYKFTMPHMNETTNSASASAQNIKNSNSPVVIKLTDHGFIPQLIIVKSGTQVEWLNQTMNTVHIQLSNSQLEKQDLLPITTVSYTFNSLGLYTYSVAKNSHLTGTVIVR